MFTGIVEGLRAVVAIEPGAGWIKLRIDLGPSAEGVRVGDSIAISGCCLTVEAVAGPVAQFHAIQETLNCTTLGSLRPGELVNVERSLRAGDPLGGHFVTGHIDGVGFVTARHDAPEQTLLTIELPPELADLVVPKGSIAFDGVSLTIASLQGRRVTVALIPHTLSITTLGTKAPGQRMNLEMDMIGKWVRRFMPGVPT